MGPHPEVPVDVQKYIGSCLIAQQPRSKRKPCPRGQHQAKDGGGNVRCCGYTVPQCSRCCSSAIQCPGYNGINNYAWTGVPLISVARQTKNPLHHPGKSRVQNRNCSGKTQDYSVPRVDSPVDSNNLEEILPISRLAIHAQGAPLILSPKDSEKCNKDGDGFPTTAPFKGRDFYLSEGGSNNRLYMLVSGCAEEGQTRSLSRERMGCFTEDESDLVMANSSRRISSSPSQSDCISTTSEDSGTSENGLPRIIKPRKRRKKDRRASESDGCNASSGALEEVTGTIVTLKPYLPLCYRYNRNGINMFPSPPRSPVTVSDNQPCDTIIINDKKWRTGTYPYPPSTRCACAYCMPPPSTFLTPPDSPVDVSENGLAMAIIRRNGGERGSPDNNRIIGREMRCISMGSSDDDSNTGFEDSVIRGQNTLVLTSSRPPQRPWIYMANKDPQSSCIFTVMCYNILCDKYATRQMYGYCPNWALDWTYRKTHILQEILHYKADIISLQEVETEQFYKYFLPELKKEGYDGIFSPKSRAKTMSECERKHVDGCAIFYKSNKFILLKEHLVEFNQLAMANAEGSDDMLNRVMTKDNIGLAALLQTKRGAYQNELTQASQTLLVCTAHIHWDPEYSDVKLIQTMMLMHELKTFVDDILQKCNIPDSQKMDPNIIPLLLCGDFNSLPDSGVIEYLSSGRVSTSHCDFKEFVYKDCLSKLGNSAKTNEFTHPFQISRAYSDGIMPFTNYSYDFKGVIDYVFYSKLHMSVLGVLGPIDSAWLEENRIQGCPHPHVPSDHFPIVVELQLKPTIPLHPPPPNGVSLHR